MDFGKLLDHIRSLFTITSPNPVPVVNAQQPLGNGLPPQLQAKLDAENKAFLSQHPVQSPTPQPTPTLVPQAPPNPYMDILKQNFPPDQVNNASNIMFVESGFNPYAYNTNTKQGGSGHAKSFDELLSIIKQYPMTDIGPFQINQYWQRNNLQKMGYAPQDMADPAKATRFARSLYDQQGWNPWYASDKLGLRR